MSWKAIRLDVLERVVADLGSAFATKDASEDDRVRRAHPDPVGHRNYHIFVGRALSAHRTVLGLIEERKGTARGSVWRRRFLGSSPTPSAPSPSGPAPEVDIGPQHPSDPAFTARLRLHQSWYRARVLKLPCGTGPRPAHKSRFGNMLTPADGAAGCNFLTPGIAAVARGRVAAGHGAVEPYRLFHNMLSSMPMCFNLFGPLVEDRALAAQLLSDLVPEVVAEVTRVAMEWAPEPAGEYLGDRTAFDAFIEYRTPEGALCALGIETKLTEPFSQKVYDGESYRRWMRAAEGVWRPEAGAQVQRIEHNQLWRDHLLAVALQHHPRSPYGRVRLLVVHHSQDPDCRDTFDGYRALLRADDDSLAVRDLESIVAAWSRLAPEPAHAAWLDAFHLRYLDLDRSAAARS